MSTEFFRKKVRKDQEAEKSSKNKSRFSFRNRLVRT